MVESEEAVHEFAEHVAAVNVLKEHELVPDTVYPVLHLGWHVEPLARELVQSPMPPVVGAADASHDLETHPVKGPATSSPAWLICPEGHAKQPLSELY